MNVLLTSAMVLITCAFLVWAIKQRNDLRSKKMYITFYLKVIEEFLEGEDNNPFLKESILVMAPHIQNRKAADFVSKAMEEGNDRRGESEIAKLMEGVNETPNKEQVQFLKVIFYYLMALSYSSPKYGGQLRRRLRGELFDQEAMARETERAQRGAFHSNEGNLAAA